MPNHTNEISHNELCVCGECKTNNRGIYSQRAPVDYSEQAAELKQFAANGQARKDAEAVIELCGIAAPIDLTANNYTVGLTSTIQLPPEMEYGEAVDFENQRVAFGKHNGSTVAEIPTGYLRWLAEQDGTIFSYSLVRYVGSERFAERET